MQLPLRDFATIVASASAAVQGAARTALDLSVGSTLRAILEAHAGVATWMQWMSLQVLQTCRAATSTGADLDSWMGDFGLTRLPGVAARGTVTVGRFAPLAAALVPAGTPVRTADGSHTFLIQPEPSHPAWSAAQNGFVLPAGTASVDVPVAATDVGAGGNVQAGVIALLVAALPGVDTVVNALPTLGGQDAETDAAFRNRFALFLNSRARATPTAIAAAVASVQIGLSWTVQENTAPDGSPQPGVVTVTVDDGSGAPGPALIAAVASAVEAVRAAGTQVTVRAPAVTVANVTLSVRTIGGTVSSDVAAAVAAAVAGHIGGLPVGAPLPWSRLVQVAYDASPAIANITAVSINGAVADLLPGPGGVVRPGVIAVE